MSSLKVIFGKNLRSLLEERDIKQVELARKFKVSPNTVQRWLKGETLPSSDVTIAELAEFLKVETEDLLTETTSIEMKLSEAILFVHKKISKIPNNVLDKLASIPENHTVAWDDIEQNIDICLQNINEEHATKQA